MEKPTTDELRNAITEMDNLAQNAFSEIAIIAELAMESLERPEGYAHPQRLAYAFQTIYSKAMDIENCINATAEGVGCNYKDKAFSRRLEAARKAEEIAISGRD